MNKQELIDKLKKLPITPSEIEGYDFDYGHDFGVERAISLAEDLDESVIQPELEKPVVPQFVADYIDSERNSCSTLSEALGNMYYEQRITDWFYINSETFAKAWLYGYEVEKEKLYTVEIPIANSPMGYHYVLRKTTSGEIIIDSFFTNNWGNYDYCQLTKEEIKKDHEWAWKYAEDVEE